MLSCIPLPPSIFPVSKSRCDSGAARPTYLKASASSSLLRPIPSTSGPRRGKPYRRDEARQPGPATVTAAQPRAGPSPPDTSCSVHTHEYRAGSRDASPPESLVPVRCSAQPNRGEKSRVPPLPLPQPVGPDGTHHINQQLATPRGRLQAEQDLDFWDAHGR